METLIDTINRNYPLKIKTTQENLDSLIKRIDENNKIGFMHDETIWTIVTILPYLEAQGGLNRLFKVLTGELILHDINECWIEALPIPPRLNEGNTNVDLAIGDIKERNKGPEEEGHDKKGNGIAYNLQENGTICFCEMKWFSDISTHVTHCQKRNQLLRVIENAITFQDNGSRPGRFYFTLVTPRYFKEQIKPYSRYYSYIFNEYNDNHQMIIDHLKECEQYLPKRTDYSGWKYPENIDSLLCKLKLKWVTFEDIINQAPDGDIKKAVLDVYDKKCQFK